jgi:hypothetical protein
MKKMLLKTLVAVAIATAMFTYTVSPPGQKAIAAAPPNLAPDQVAVLDTSPPASLVSITLASTKALESPPPAVTILATENIGSVPCLNPATKTATTASASTQTLNPTATDPPPNLASAVVGQKEVKTIECAGNIYDDTQQGLVSTG